jgi:riboflavin kinase/FMN adenylyltransferase
VWVTKTLKNVLTPTNIALGNFDGVHRGHWQVIQPILPTEDFPNQIPRDGSSRGGLKDHRRWETETSETVSPAAVSPDSFPEKTYATIVTFIPHPREFFTGQSLSLLTPEREKETALRALGVEQLVWLPFDRELASLTPSEFVDRILVKHLHAKQVSIGSDFCFGRNRSGTAQDLSELASQYGIRTQIIPLKNEGWERISSSAIREALQSGNVERANQLLGRSYQIVGDVVAGQKVGRTIGFPTANLRVPPEKFLPCLGVYSVWVQTNDTQGTTSFLPGVTNIGSRPTVNGQQVSVEVHLLDWSGDLYGQTLTLHLQTFLRPEQKFASLDELKAQIARDCELARSYHSYQS